jgi:hypothetical protein
MGRPREFEEERVTTAFRLPQPLHQQLRAAADERQVAANLLVVKALEDYLSRLPPVETVVTPQMSSASVSDPPGTVDR